MSQLTPSKSQTFRSSSLLETEQIGAQFAADIVMPSCIYLHGDLGSGKTTLCKTIIKSLGQKGVVTSPTYNLIQEYPIATGVIYHMDLYRLESPQELAFLAIPDLWTQDSVFLIEWPANGEGLLPNPTHKIEIKSNILNTNSRDITIDIY